MVGLGNTPNSPCLERERQFHVCPPARPMGAGCADAPQLPFWSAWVAVPKFSDSIGSHDVDSHEQLKRVVHVTSCDDTCGFTDCVRPSVRANVRRRCVAIVFWFALHVRLVWFCFICGPLRAWLLRIRVFLWRDSIHLCASRRLPA